MENPFDKDSPLRAELPADDVAYFDELAAEISRHGGSLEEAHARRQAFVGEMLKGKTVRARMARAAIAIAVYANIQRKNSISRLMHECEYIASEG